MNMVEFVYNRNIFYLLNDRNAVFKKQGMFYSENCVKRGIIYRYLIVEYPPILTETRWGCLHCVVKKSADRVVYFRKTGDCELCEDRTFGLVHCCVPSTQSGADRCSVFLNDWVNELVRTTQVVLSVVWLKCCFLFNGFSVLKIKSFPVFLIFSLGCV